MAPSLGSWLIGPGLSASFAGATAAQIQRVLLRLLAGPRVDDELADGDPPIVADVRVVLVVVWCCGERIAVGRYRVLVHS